MVIILDRFKVHSGRGYQRRPLLCIAVSCRTVKRRCVLPFADAVSDRNRGLSPFFLGNTAVKPVKALDDGNETGHFPLRTANLI